MALQGHCTEGKIILIGLTEKRDRYSGGEKRRLAEKILPFISTFFLHEMKGVVNVVYNSATYKMRNAFFVSVLCTEFYHKNPCRCSLHCCFGELLCGFGG